MTQKLLIIGTILITFNCYSQSNDDLLTTLSYANYNIKKSYNSNNIYHVKEYAEKAINSINNYKLNSHEELNELIYKFKENLNNCINEDNFERSKFYAKRSKILSLQILKLFSFYNK